MAINNILVRFGPHMTPALENAMADYGFHFYARKAGKWVIYRKHLEAKRGGEGWQKALEERVNGVIDKYLDPYSNMMSIQEELFGIAKELPPEQERWVLAWMKKNIESEFFTPPWEKDDEWDEHAQALGAC